MIKDGGRIVNISSGLARFSFDGYSAYAAMKGAVEVLTRYLAKELAPRRITANTLAPGAIETDFRDGAIRDKPRSETANLGDHRAGTRLACRMISAEQWQRYSPDNCGWINGQRIEVSGGMFL